MAEFTPIEARFFKLGGTWDMAPDEHGELRGVGRLDDTELAQIENSLVNYATATPRGIAAAERRLSRIIYDSFRQTPPESTIGEVVKHWCPDFGKYVNGSFYGLYSGDSSHLRASLNAPIVSFMLESLVEDPKKPIIGAQGTDTADSAILPLLDVFLYDTSLPAVVLTGANRSWREPNSDAPGNFLDMARFARSGLAHMLAEPRNKISERGSGSWWIFQDGIYPGADLVKIDPLETRKGGVEGQITFFSPNQWNDKISVLFGEDEDDFFQDFKLRHTPDQKGFHVLTFYKKGQLVDVLYRALNLVNTIDLGSQNPIEDDVKAILDMRKRIIVVAAHSLGNTSDPIRQACIEATKRGKVVIDASRCLIGETNVTYAGSLLGANDKELAESKLKIISANKFNKTAARAVAVRSLVEIGLATDPELTYLTTDRIMEDYYETRYGPENTKEPGDWAGLKDALFGTGYDPKLNDHIREEFGDEDTIDN